VDLQDTSKYWSSTLDGHVRIYNFILDSQVFFIWFVKIWLR
jgi:hypothetical protein